MVVTDTIEGIVDGTLWFHVDLANDVLYLRLAHLREEPTTAEETADGSLLLRSECDDRIVGLTIVDWWKRFGADDPTAVPLAELERRIAESARRLAA